MASISLRRTGLVVFGSKLVSIFTGLIFLTMITGWLTPAKFGLWEVIVDLVTFASYPAGVVAFWATRDIARGRVAGRSAILINLGLSLFGLGAFLVVSFFSHSALNSDFFTFLLASLLVPAAYWNAASNAAVTGYRPSVAGASTLISEVCKLAVAYPTLFVFQLGIDGVILAILASYVAQAAVSTYMVRGVTGDALDLSSGKRWLSGFWIPVFYSLPYEVAIFDTIISTLVGGSVLTGYYQAAFSIAAMVGLSSSLSFALYPLLLRGGSEDAPSVTLDFSLLFGIPMAAGVMMLSPSLLYLLNKAYSTVANGLVVLSLSALVGMVSTITDATLMGRERVDAEAGTRFRSYLRSDLLFVPAVNTVSALVYIGSVYALTDFGLVSGLTTSAIVFFWAVAQLVTSAPFVAIKLRRLRRKSRLHLTPSFPRYLLSAALMSLMIYLVAPAALSTSVDRLEFGIRIAFLVLLGASVYFFTLAAIDSRVRRLGVTFLKGLRALQNPRRADETTDGQSQVRET